MFQVLVFICVQMLQTYVVKVDLDIAYVAMTIHACLKSICFKCFIRFGLYVANVSSLCLKSRSGVAHVKYMLVANGQRPVAAWCCCGWRRRGSRAGAGWAW
jgi:hypothetical protein